MEALEVADRWFFETVVRIHRAGEAAPFTGLKPAGLDVGPSSRRPSERWRAAGELAEVLCGEIREQVERRHAHALELRAHAADSIPQATRWRWFCTWWSWSSGSPPLGARHRCRVISLPATSGPTTTLSMTAEEAVARIKTSF